MPINKLKLILIWIGGVFIDNTSNKKEKIIYLSNIKCKIKIKNRFDYLDLLVPIIICRKTTNLWEKLKDYRKRSKTKVKFKDALKKYAI